jgi:psp operon transcriptional activator
VRIIGATNADLPALCREQRFKQDLLDRLSFEVLFMPPLRVRGNDILLLADHFASRMAYELGREYIPEFSPAVAQQMLSYPWPGNVRELKNTVERAVYRTQGPMVTEITLDPFRNPYQAGTDSFGGGAACLKPEALADLNLSEAKEELELAYLLSSLEKSGGSQKEAAELLGLSYDQFRGLYRKHRGRLAELQAEAEEQV